MPDRNKVFDAIRNCITEPKCKDCPWGDCEKVGCKRVTVPVTLMLDVLNVLKEQQETITSLQNTICKLSAALGEQESEWVEDSDPGQEYGTTWACRKCMHSIHMLFIWNPYNCGYKHCPHCGAKMVVKCDD